jgi:hypothetical protein
VSQRDTAKELIRTMLLSHSVLVKESTTRLVQLAASLGESEGYFFEKSAALLKDEVYPKLDMEDQRKLGNLISAIREDLRVRGRMGSDEYDSLRKRNHIPALTPEEVDRLMTSTIHNL